MTKIRFEAMHTVFRNANAILWVTSGVAWGKNLLANVSVGLGHKLLAERSDLRLPSEILLAYEPHLVLIDSAFYIPKVLPLDSLNHTAVEVAKQDTVDKGTTERKGTFATDKPYILFGMTGDLGISIAC
ncbi:predicted protein [Plenodomus lingam JN3]|uniref:Uncharacterized protein n=2 Tax=Leptosphaeria maculans TaxID=5022 RepID=E4ZGU6_LEPMJ|nr:predicted protein [Plenodomus lingam JN3]CBX90516.1 predicted protein [Plenodomus lingam JN3]